MHRREKKLLLSMKNFVLLLVKKLGKDYVNILSIYQSVTFSIHCSIFQVQNKGQQMNDQALVNYLLQPILWFAALVIILI